VFHFLLHQFFSLGKLEIVPFLFNFLLKAQTTKIDKEKAVFRESLGNKHGIFTKMPLAIVYLSYLTDFLSHF